MGIDTKFVLSPMIFPEQFVESDKMQRSFQLHHRHAGLALAVAAQAEALNGPVFLQYLVDGSPQRAGPRPAAGKS